MKYIDPDKLSKEISNRRAMHENNYRADDDKTELHRIDEDDEIIKIVQSLQREKISFKKVVNEKTGRISLIPNSGEKYFLVLYFGADPFVWTPIHKLQHLYCEIEAIGGVRVASDVHMWAKSAAIGDVIRRDNFSVLRISEEQYNK